MTYPDLQFKQSKMKALWDKIKSNGYRIPMSELSRSSLVYLRLKLNPLGFSVYQNADMEYQISPKGKRPRGGYVGSMREHKNPAKLIKMFKAGREMDYKEIQEEFGLGTAGARSLIYFARKWLRKEGLFLANVGGGYGTPGKYKLLQEEDMSQEANRRHSLIANHFNNVQDLIISGIERYRNNPEISLHLEELILSIQEAHIHNKRRLLTQSNAESNHDTNLVDSPRSESATQAL